MSTSLLEKYEIKEDIALGSYSVIRRCTDKQRKKEYAAKLVYLKKLSTRDYNRLEQEVEICRKLDHQNIVRLYASGKESGLYYLIFDLILGCDLFDAISTKEYYSEIEAKLLVKQILAGMKYYQGLNIIHRDLKLENIRLTSREPNAVVKIIDFGLAIMAPDKDFQRHGVVGTRSYIAPEVIKQEPYGKPVDMWSCGVIVYILLCGYPPFWEEREEDLFKKIREGNFAFKLPEWKDVSETAKSLVSAMLTVDSLKRIQTEKALKHSWFVKNTDEEAHSSSVVTYARLRNFSPGRKLHGLVLFLCFAAWIKSHQTEIRANSDQL